MLKVIIFGIVMFILGWILHAILKKKTCEGALIVNGEELYLNISEKDMKAICSSNKSSINIQIKRR